MKQLALLRASAQLSPYQGSVGVGDVIFFSAASNQFQSIFKLNLPFAGLSHHTKFGAVLLTFGKLTC